jgi:GxxExxY protein
VRETSKLNDIRFLNSLMPLKYEELTGKIIGCAMKVHRKMGTGYQEPIYSRCLAIEFEKVGISYKKECEQPIYYYDIQVGKKRVDFIVDGKICLEIKALTELTDKELNLALNYLESFKLDHGLLINFGSKSLQFKRLINDFKNNSKYHN